MENLSELEKIQDQEVIDKMSRITGVKYSEEQEKILKHHGGMCILACAGSGKALENGTGVLTPDGYTAIENLSIDDEVFDQNGTLQHVTGVFPQGKKQVHEVYFEDGSKINCCEDHLWIYKTSQMIKDDSDWKVAPTKELGHISMSENDGTTKGLGIFTPVTGKVEFTPIIMITSPFGLGRTIESLEEIEEGYITNSVENRESLLDGILYAVGERTETGFTVALPNEKVINDIKYVSETLGYLAYVTYSEDEGNYILTVNTKAKYREVTKIVKTDRYAEMTCIMVSGDTHSFLTENCIVTHNTTCLTHLIAKRLQTNEIKNANTLLCTTYSKGGALEMEQRLNKLLGTLGINKQISVKTMHALYLGILKHFGFPSSVIEGRDRTKFLKEACKDAEVVLDDDDFRTLDSLISYQINNLLKDSDLVQSYAYTLDNVPLEKYSAIRQGYNLRKVQAKVVDFDDMQLYIYSLMYNQKRQDIIDYCRSMWTDIYVDEAQDMSRIQYEILKKIITNPDKLVVIGDDDQCIYQWRGADPAIILNVCADFDITKFTLSTNYRCAGNIVDRAAVGIVHNTRRSEKDIKAFFPGGEIKICDCGSSNLYAMSKYAYKHIKKLVMDDKVRPDKIAVLSRNNGHLCILSNMLFKDGIHCEATEEMKLTKVPAYKSIKDILELALNGYNDKLTESTLYKCCIFLKRSDSKRIASLQASLGVRLSDLLGYMCMKFWKRTDVKWNGKINVPALAELKTAQSLSYLRAETIENLVLIYKLLTDPDLVKRSTGLLALYLTATEFQYKDNPDKKRTIEGLVDYLSDLIKTMGYSDTKQFLKVSEQYEEGRMAIPGAKVCMSTMHGAKGREWDNVVLFADDNITFPSFNGIVTQLKRGIAMSDIYYGIDENRRLHYVAMTRAKKQLAIFTDKKNVGLFTLESLGIFDYGAGNNAHIVSMASQGEVYRDLLEKSDEIIFGKRSKYRYDIDISDISANIEIDYLYRGGKEKQTLSIDDIQTSQPVILPD